MTEKAGTMGEGRSGNLPERFGAFRVQEVIGAGGMGIVYRALDEALQREVALKTLAPALAVDPDFVTRFKREAQSAAALNHPNITQIYAIGQEGPIPFFAMELIHGRSLEALVRDHGPLDPSQTAGYIAQAAHGLRHAHERQLIHRDVKPSNLMLTEDGIVKITDFGLAKAARSETKLTATGEVLGSPGYISPEQAQGGPIDARSDIYSLGATFYHLVTGRLPFEAPTPVAMIIKHMNEPLRSPRASNPNIPFPIAAIIQKMMAKRPGERFQDYDALLRELDRAITTLPASGAPGRPVVGGTGAAAHGLRTGSARMRPGPPARSAPPEIAPVEDRSAGVFLPKALAILLAGLVLVGALKHLREVRQETAAHAGASRLSAGGGERTAIASPLEAGGTFTSQPGPGGSHSRSDPALDDGPGESTRPESHPDLVFITNDHEILPDGRLKVTGRIRNRGTGTASRVRVRLLVMLGNGTVVARGETPLVPSTIPPGGSAAFELPIDYTGPIGRIKAELLWVD